MLRRARRPAPGPAQCGVGRRAIGHQAAAVQHQHAVGGQRQRQVVQHGGHGHAGACAAGQAAHQRTLMRRIQVRGGFVQQQHGGIHRQRTGQQHTLAFAARQFAQAARCEAVASVSASARSTAASSLASGAPNRPWRGSRPRRTTSRAAISPSASPCCASQARCCARSRAGQSASGARSAAPCRHPGVAGRPAAPAACSCRRHWARQWPPIGRGAGAMRDAVHREVLAQPQAQALGGEHHWLHQLLRRRNSTSR
jgi:hypothetical protein